MATSLLSSALLRSARSYAGQLTSLIKSFAPNHLQSKIKTHADEIEDGVVVISIEVKGPDAHAQEYGSGLHRIRGAKAKYPIKPKNRKFLAFNWEVANANPEKFQFLPDGRVMLTSVQHPGIERYKGQGYITPAIKEFRQKIKGNSTLNQEIKQAILGEIRKSFTTGGKSG